MSDSTKQELDEPIVAEIHISKGRRGFGLFTFAGASLLVLYCGLFLPDLPFGNRLVLIAAAFGLGALGWRMKTATDAYLILTQSSLRASTGEVLARLDEVTRIERGMLSIKPSNGFALKLDTKRPLAWYPGVWGRMGKRVFVGGVTMAAQARPVADIIAAQLIQRAQDKVDAAAAAKNTPDGE